MGIASNSEIGTTVHAGDFPLRFEGFEEGWTRHQ